jgi:AraC-like DNA-binding protein
VESDQPYERIVIHFGLKHLEGFNPGDYRVLNFITKRKVGHNNRIDGKEIDTDIAYTHINAIEQAITGNHPHAHLLVKSHFIQLLVVLNSLYCENLKDRLTDYYLDTRVARIMAYLNAHLDEPVSLDLLEKEFAVNKYYMCHLFKQKTGFSVFEYLRNKRIMKAKQLLLAGRTVLETCYDVGFNDYSSFSKAFKATVGIPPKQFSKMG